MDNLKLIAFDTEDLRVLSAHLQDAVLKLGDMAYLPKAKRFAAIVSRFDWLDAIAAGTGRSQSTRPGKNYARRQAAVRFERVLSARSQGFDPTARGNVLSMLALQFEPKEVDAPEGVITLVFAGGAAIQLQVECIEAELKDLGPAWGARARPAHALEDGSDSGTGSAGS